MIHPQIDYGWRTKVPHRSDPMQPELALQLFEIAPPGLREAHDRLNVAKLTVNVKVIGYRMLSQWERAEKVLSHLPFQTAPPSNLSSLFPGRVGANCLHLNSM